MIHFDSHTDLFNSYFGGTIYTHGTPFRRAVEEGLLDPKRVIQIGIRGTAYDKEDHDFANSVGIRIIMIEEFFERGIKDVMMEARDIVGTKPTYISYDIDFVDPTFAPGTGTPEVGGINVREAQMIIRNLRDLSFIGADVVEVSPPFDVNNMTSLVGATIAFEILCTMTKTN